MLVLDQRIDVFQIFARYQVTGANPQGLFVLFAGRCQFALF